MCFRTFQTFRNLNFLARSISSGGGGGVMFLMHFVLLKRFHTLFSGMAPSVSRPFNFKVHVHLNQEFLMVVRFKRKIFMCICNFVFQ